MAEATSEMKSDPVLDPFLRAATSAGTERELQRLLEMEAAPVMRQVLQRDARRRSGEESFGNFASSDNATDWEDVLSGAREELIRQLTRLRMRERTEPIANFRGYVSAVTYSVWAEHLRRAYPARSMLLNRLRYLLENRTKQRGFAIWDGPTGERWCGFARWNGQTPIKDSAKLQRLMVEPLAAAADAVGTADFKSLDPPLLLAKIFSWLDRPIELRHLLDVMAELLEISDRKESLSGDSAYNLSLTTVDPSPSPIEALKWREYLRWLWQEMDSLSIPQRKAFLFHSEVARDFEILGIASMRKIAALLEIAAEEIAQIWNDLPLPDLTIAKQMSLERQQVINLRRVARDRLGAAWEKWINEEN
jgi:hypothetical protein